MELIKRFFTVFFTSAFLVTLSGAAVYHWWGEHLLSKARAMQDEGNIDGAHVYFKRSLRYGKFEAAINLAKIAYTRRQWAQVRRYADKAMRMNPMRGYPHTLMAYALAAEMQRWDADAVERVLEESRRSVKLEPMNGGLWRSHADLSLKIFVNEVRMWDNAVARNAYRMETVEAYRGVLRYNSRKAQGVITSLTDYYPDKDFLLDITVNADPSVRQQLESILVRKDLWREGAP